MRLKDAFKKAATRKAVPIMVPASLIVTTALFSGGCATMQDITPQIENEMRQGIQMKSPGIPHKEALSCLAQIFNERFPNDRLVVTKMKESSGKFSEDFGFYLPQDPHIMLETILTNAGFRVSSRDTNFRTSLTERQGMQKGLIKPVYNQKFSPVTIGLTGAVTGLEFAVQSEAAKAGIGPVGVRYEQSRGKLSVDIKAVDLETGSNLWAASSSVSFRSREGGPSYHDFGILGLDDDYFLIGLQGGQTPSLSDLARAGMAKAVYETLAPFIQEKRGLCDRCIEKQDLSSAQIESAHSASSANTSSKSPSMDR